MKKLLILLVCGFAFTQSIQTKQVVIPISSDENIYDFSDYIELESGYYSYRIINVEGLVGMFHITDYFRFEPNNCPIYVENFFGGLNINAPYDYVIPSFYLDSEIEECSSTFQYFWNNVDEDVDEDPVFSGNFVFHITGMFEDEGIGLQGDMNDDEIINVIDVVALVSVIVGEE
jgi:hypothetical protein